MSVLSKKRSEESLQKARALLADYEYWRGAKNAQFYSEQKIALAIDEEKDKLAQADVEIEHLKASDFSLREIKKMYEARILEAEAKVKACSEDAEMLAGELKKLIGKNCTLKSHKVNCPGINSCQVAQEALHLHNERGGK